MSLRKAINDHCKSCVYDPRAGGTWLQQVEQCAVKRCALYAVRPMRKGQIHEQTIVRRVVMAGQGCSVAKEAKSGASATLEAILTLEPA